MHMQNDNITRRLDDALPLDSPKHVPLHHSDHGAQWQRIGSSPPREEIDSELGTA